MPNTVPHQKVVKIHRENVDRNFIQISKDNFYNAYQDLNSTATMLYLYLAGNKDGYDLAFSPEAVKNSLGMPTTTCRDQFKKLLEKGYLTQRKPNSNIFDFHEIAQTP